MTGHAKRLSKLEKLNPKMPDLAWIVLRPIVSARKGSPVRTVLRFGRVIGIPGRLEREANESEQTFYERLQAIRHIGSSDITQVEQENAIEHLHQTGQLETYEAMT